MVACGKEALEQVREGQLPGRLRPNVGQECQASLADRSANDYKGQRRKKRTTKPSPKMANHYNPLLMAVGR